MSVRDKKLVRIPASEASGFSRWRMPEMSEAERKQLIALARKTKVAEPEVEPVEVVEDPLYAEKLTVKEWERIREEARQEGYQQGLEEGREAGRQAGHQEGVAAGLKAAQAQIDEQLSQIGALMAAFREPFNGQEAQLHQLIVSLVVRLAKAMVEAEFTHNPALLEGAVQQALSLIPAASGTPELSLHPDDCELIASLAEREGWILKPDTLAARGDLRILAGGCQVEQNLEQRFDQVASQWLQTLAGNSADESG